jgi:hypothetical protein
MVIPQAITNDPETGHAFVAYFGMRNGTAQVTVAEVDAAGVVLTETPLLLDDGSPAVFSQDKPNNVNDSHNALSIAMDTAGYVHVTGNVHNGWLPYWRSASPHSVTVMTTRLHLPGVHVLRDGSGSAVPLLAAGEERVASYPTLFTGRNGELFLQFRHMVSGDGNLFVLAYDPATTTWTSVAGSALSYGFDNGLPLLRGQAQPNGVTMSPYATTPVVGPDGNYWMAWSWRDSSTDADTNSRISVAKSPDLRTWYTAKGVRLPSTIDYSSTETDPKLSSLVVDELAPSGSGHLNDQLALGFDGSGRPVVDYFRYNGTGDAKHTGLHVARLSGLNNWVSAEVVAFSGLYDLRGGASPSTLLSDTPARAVPGTPSTVEIDYFCTGTARTLTVGPGSFTGASTVLSNTYSRSNPLPLSASVLFPSAAGYDVAPRTAVSETFSSATGRARWVLKWDAGAYIVDGGRPTGRVPADGSLLSLSLVSAE